MTKTKSIVAIKEELARITDLSDPIWQALATDPRKGVQTALSSRKKTIQKEIKERQRLKEMMRYERALYDQGYHLVAGVDEVGRGPLAGPVVAAAVILPKDVQILGLNDSKQIPKSKHLPIYEAVRERALAIGIGIMDNDVIDRVNIYEATKLAMLEAVSQLDHKPDALLLDAMTLDCALPQTSLVKGDARSLSIAAASIVAKVTRDQIMVECDVRYPGYGFYKNAGYGTKAHLEGLAKYGITPIHRKSFEPIKSMVTKD